MRVESREDKAVEVEATTPYGDERHKADQVREMFDSIAPAYDFMNRAMTLGIDKLWRAKAVGMIRRANPQSILDVATGTGDLAIKMARKMPRVNVTGLDLSPGMVQCGNAKVAKAGLADRVTLQVGDSLEMPYADDTFDCVTVAYGVRNFEHLLQGYREMARVLRPGGMLLVIELSTPTSPIVKPLYRFYTRTVIPTVGRLVSKDRRAYTYLPESIAKVPQGEAMTALMRQAGLSDTRHIPMTFGTCTIYVARKP